MSKFRVLDLFSGIGGFSLGLERTGGFETVAFVEINPFCQQVLAKHWPTVPQFGDVKHVTLETLRERGIDGISVITAGFPCQPFSQAGKRKGADDERFLWPDIIRLVREIRPRYLILENVPNLLSLNDGFEFGIILGELAQSGYDAEWQVLSAAAFGAPHLRERLWIVAYPNAINGEHERTPGEMGSASSEACSSKGKQIQVREAARGSGANLAHSNQPGSQRRQVFTERPDWLAGQGGMDRRGTPDWTGGDVGQPSPLTERGAGREIERDFRGVPHGVSRRMDRLRSLGNAVVPIIPEYIGRCILAAH